MATLQERLLELMKNPKVGELLQDPRVQQLVVRGFRLRGEIESRLQKRVQRIAGLLSLATQKDLRAVQRRMRHLEEALREAEARLIEAEDARAAQARS